MEDRCNNEERMMGKMRDGQMVQSKKSLVGLSINSDLSLTSSEARRLESSQCVATFG